MTERANEEPKWHERTRYQVLLFAAGIALFGIVLGLILDWYIHPQTSTQKKDLVQALGLITAGVAGAIGIFFTWRGQRDARETQEENQKTTREQLKNAEEQLRLARLSQEANQKTTQDQLEQAWNELDIARRGQITERFTQAIDQLGSESLEIRLGGIYSLERTAREDRDYHWPIMEVLITYLRTRAVLNPRGARDKKSYTLEPDSQAILNVIRRRSNYHKDVEYGSIDLSGTNLYGADLREADLEGANLQRADLGKANLVGAVLYGSTFGEANLEGVNLYGANLEGASVKGQQLAASRSLQGATMPDGSKHP